MSGFTNFNGYSHGDLRNMVQGMDSGGVMSAGDPWRRAADTLKQIRTTLDSASGDATSTWEGSSSDAFYAKMTKLATSVNNIAAYANDAAITMSMMSEAIDQAKREMPEEPDFWDKVGDAVGDTAQSAVGVDNENTRTTVTDERKAKAVAVMQTLATKYRSATSYLKPPPFGGQVDDVTDIPAPGEPSGATAIGALIMGGGMGLAGGSQSRQSGTTMQRMATEPERSAQSPKSPQSAKYSTSATTDPDIKGGLANPVPKPLAPGKSGPGTGLDGVVLGTRPPGGGLGPVTGGTGGGSGGPGSESWLSGGGQGGGTFGAGGGRDGSVSGGTARLGGGAGRGGATFGSGGLEGGEGSTGAGRAGRSGSGRAGTAIGGSGEGSSRRSFTEGGSGLGRGRGQAGQGADGHGAGGKGQGKGQAEGGPGGAKGRKKEKKADKARPGYLVEDQETWESGREANPDVVE
ncbi:WXG100 family type VII secretion target [Kitasatospora sp. McL0602]|uniref:WXG100 family type VII secretion target n=1 Tax=Kitasatospora sp. McL0602 TaxID=3439530 RepID=UPI003F89C358